MNDDRWITLEEVRDRLSISKRASLDLAREWRAKYGMRILRLPNKQGYFRVNEADFNRVLKRLEV